MGAQSFIKGKVTLLAKPAYQCLHLDGLAGKVERARLLSDGAELPLKGLAAWQLKMAEGSGFGPDLLSITLPISQPTAPVPVIELTLRD